MKHSILYLLALCLFFASCEKKEAALTGSGLNPVRFTSVNEAGKEKTQLYVLKNKNGMEVCITNTGMRIVSLLVPDKEGAMQDVLLGFDNIEPYKEMGNYLGAVTGRYTGCIANGSFQLDRVTYNIRKNAGMDCSYNGGPGGFHTRYFDIEQFDATELSGTYLSKNKEEGFPGNLSVTVTYTLTEKNTLEILYEAHTDMPTVVNLSNQLYFNLSGDPAQLVSNHQLFIDADDCIAMENDIPAAIVPITEVPYDFRETKAIDYEFDLNYVLNHSGEIAVTAAKAYCPQTGIALEIYTTHPCIRFSTSKEMDVVGKQGKMYQKLSGFRLQPQAFPDSPNQPEFPSTILRPGEMYSSQTIYKFGIE